MAVRTENHFELILHFISDTDTDVMFFFEIPISESVRTGRLEDTTSTHLFHPQTPLLFKGVARSRLWRFESVFVCFSVAFCHVWSKLTKHWPRIDLKLTSCKVFSQVVVLRRGGSLWRKWQCRIQPLGSLDGRNRAIVIAESLARVIAAIRIASVRWWSYLNLRAEN